MSNHLVQATSPYLLQHAKNPVDWYPWGEEALDRARRENRPIFLSIGYAACHWCHVMERESFENLEIASILNDHFISIKVDREERPDLDALYMDAAHLMTGRGGWPLSVFLGPDLKPFYAGTYFPPEDRPGMPGFKTLLESILRVRREKPMDLIHQGERVFREMRQLAQAPSKGRMPGKELLLEAVQQLERSFDSQWGGFGRAPKFLPHMALELLMRLSVRRQEKRWLPMIGKTLQAMGEGGIHDHLGGGFARYSTDDKWLIPHFEKMLYDQALMARCLLDARQLLGLDGLGDLAAGTLDYVLRDLRDPASGLTTQPLGRGARAGLALRAGARGDVEAAHPYNHSEICSKRGQAVPPEQMLAAFHSSEDADSEGEEGRFYTFTPQEVSEILGEEDGRLFALAFGVRNEGHLEEGRSVLHSFHRPPDLAARKGLSDEPWEEKFKKMKAKVLAFRNRRVRPAKDDKVLTDWNGLMIGALARAAQVLQNQDYRVAAEACAAFLKEELWRGGDLYHSWRQGRLGPKAFLDDFAALADGLVDLYEAGFEIGWLCWAEKLAENMCEGFEDQREGGFFSTREDARDLLYRQKSPYDQALPSGNTLAARALLRLGRHLERQDFLDSAAGILRALGPRAAQSPRAFQGLLNVLDEFLEPILSIVIVGDPASIQVQELLLEVHRRFLPGRILSVQSEGTKLPLHQNRPGKAGSALAYVCYDKTCLAPIQDPVALGSALDGMGLEHEHGSSRRS